MFRRQLIQVTIEPHDLVTHLVNMYDLCTQDALIGPLFEGSHLSKDNGFMLFFSRSEPSRLLGSA